MRVNSTQAERCGAFANAYLKTTGAPLFVPPAIYDRLEKAGTDMRGMRRNEQLETEDLERLNGAR